MPPREGCAAADRPPAPPRAAPAYTPRAAGSRPVVGLPDLDDPAAMHHRDPVAEIADHAKVVADQHEAEPQPPLQLQQQVENLPAQRDVERRGRLVRHDQPRVERKRARDDDALPLAAAECVRVALAGIGGQPTSSRSRATCRGSASPLCSPCMRIGSADHLLDRHARIERGKRVLKDHPHLAMHRSERRRGPAPPDRPRRPSRMVIADRAGAGRQHADDAVAQRGLARSALAHDAEVLALEQLEATSPHRRRWPAAARRNSARAARIAQRETARPSAAPPGGPDRRARRRGRDAELCARRQASACV